MRFSYVRLPLLAATAWLGIGFSVWAMDLRYAETVYVSPATATYSLAPSYLVTSSYVRPSAYVLPTGYVRPSAYIYPTAYSTAYISQPVSLLPTTYVATTWPSAYVATTYRRGLFGRQWVVERPVLASYATTYVPSAYVVPTYYTSSYRVKTYTPTVYEYPAVWETAAVTSRGVDCDEVTWVPPVGSSQSSRQRRFEANHKQHGRADRVEGRPDHPFGCLSPVGRGRRPAVLGAGCRDQGTDSSRRPSR